MAKLLIRKEVNIIGSIIDDVNIDVIVLIITYNHGKFIKQCIDSIINQKVSFNFKIYIGEDESTDETRNICLNYAKIFPNKIVVFLNNRENNLRIGGNKTGRFNWLYTMSQVKSKYIAFCEGDDYWNDENKLQKQFSILENNNNVSICGHDSYLQKGKDYLDITFTRKQNKKYIETGMVSFFKYLYPGFFMHTSSFFFRNTYNYINELTLTSTVGDLPLFLLTASKGKCFYINEPLSVYRLNENSFTQKNIVPSTKMLLSFGLTYLKAIPYFSIKGKLVLIVGFLIRLLQIPYAKYVAKVK